MDFELTDHAKDVLAERKISEEWVWKTLNEPEKKETGNDNNLHYFRKIPEYGFRILHVVVNPETLPKEIITIFFDRREIKNEIKNR